MKYFITCPESTWEIQDTKNNSMLENVISDKSKYPQYLVFNTPKAAKKKLKKLLNDPLAKVKYENAIKKLYKKENNNES